MVLPVGIIGVAILSISWWPILAHNICMFSHQIPYRGRNGAVFSLMTSGLTIKTGLERYKCFSYCPYFMLICHFKFFHPSGKGGKLSL